MSKTSFATVSASTVGDLLTAFLEEAGVRTAFGVLSVHNMPLLDALARRASIRFVCARGEAGAVNMADAYARVSGSVGIAFTSTGAGAGNACGSLIEAATAGTPLLHFTGQIATGYLDQGCGDVHEVKDQLGMMRAVCKAAFRVRSVDTALGTFREALHVALSAPTGPVSIEIPIDLQGAPLTAWPSDLSPRKVVPSVPDAAQLDALATRLASARRPMLWLGGGARHAGDAARLLLDLGFGLVTTIQGRGVVDEHDTRTLGAFNLHPAIERLYKTCDAMVVVGSKLRVPETGRHTLTLPQPLFRIDVDPQVEGRGYRSAQFVCGDAALAMQGLAERLRGISIDPTFGAELFEARRAAEQQVRANIGRYSALCDALQATLYHEFNWVRDVTISNGTWGARLPRITGPRQSAHASGGGIGQGLSMAIGAALAAPDRRTIALVGDGGLALNAAELPTAVQEDSGVVLLVMNDRGYGILRNLADAQFDGRRAYSDLLTPDFALLARAHGYEYHLVQTLDGIEAKFRTILGARPAATLVEFDMDAIGPFARPFSGPKI